MQLSDLRTATLNTTLTNTVGNGADFGLTYIRYEVQRVTNVRNLQTTAIYRIVCTHRVFVPNPTPFNIVPTTVTSYANYPIMLGNEIYTGLMPSGVTVRLVDYSPRTLNAGVTVAGSDGEGATSTTTRQYTAGSLTAQTNDYATSIHADERRGSSAASRSSPARGIATDEPGAIDAMSLKDWGCYASFYAPTNNLTWTWGQEHPWDVFRFRSISDATGDVSLPESVLQQLFDNPAAPTMVFPPSQLAVMGLDFTMRSVWEVEVAQNVDPGEFQFSHVVSMLPATHGIAPSGAKTPTITSIDLSTVCGFSGQSPALDLVSLALEPVLNGAATNGAAIAFVAAKFMTLPAPQVTFKILSDANNLIVTGTGFEAPMTTSFANGAVSLNVGFKITDDVTQYALFMKHWNTGGGGCVLSVQVNGGAVIKRRVDSAEGTGGSDNLTTIVLRNRDYTSAEFHDFLVKGMNNIAITITQDANSPSGSGYELRALAIGEV